MRVLVLITGVLFAIYPALRPYSTETGQAAVDAFSSPMWTAAHVSAMAGFITLALAVRAARPGRIAETSTWVGVGLVLPYYGAETFGLAALAVRAQETGNTALIDTADAIRYGPVQVVMFGAGLVLIAVGTVALARRIGSWQSWTFAAGFVLLLPQFYAPSWLRIAHGILILVGAVAFAAQSRRQESSTTTGA